MNHTLLGVGNVVLCQGLLMGNLLMESRKEKLFANSLFCLWSLKFSNRTVLSCVLSCTDSCVLELPYSCCICTSLSLSWFNERFCFFVLCTLIFLISLLYHFGPHVAWKTWTFSCMMTPVISSQKYLLISESAHQILRQIAMGQNALASGRKNLICSFWFLLILEYAYFIDFLISCYKT